MPHHHTPSSPPPLTRNQRHVLDVLLRGKTALSAYNILGQLRGQGFRAPLQVYRALEKLIDLGLVHRLESLNAFVACSHQNCNNHELVAFAICQKCGIIAEFDNENIANDITKHMQTMHFQPTTTALEIRGLCKKCK
ncbi:MAG: Ferric uptake regulator Fur family protein [Candidatus Tokpelaia hoelldobleri]|uniref:Ferric uptake regulator Fur family protein n=1 Tax=Candidatus Tokpelaia hoelldobleri TaxID=1902579 RepID=A0A1U9JUI2_9HYPH|nr:MAG: Ferric uptake regulator Fur family protein [Candidatus Tokpelaia hoelldoblerii]